MYGLYGIAPGWPFINSEQNQRPLQLSPLLLKSTQISPAGTCTNLTVRVRQSNMLCYQKAEGPTLRTRTKLDILTNSALLSKSKSCYGLCPLNPTPPPPHPTHHINFSQHMNFTRQCALRHILTILSISAPCGQIWAVLQSLSSLILAGSFIQPPCKFSDFYFVIPDSNLVPNLSD